MAKPDKKAKSESQLAKFKEAAREHETDDDEKEFEKRLRAVAKASSADKPK